MPQANPSPKGSARRPALFLAAIVLTGCVLHSGKPLFGESDAVLALGNRPVTFTLYQAEKGAWVLADDPKVTAIPEGNHYLIPDPATPEDMTSADPYYFVSLDAAHYLVMVVVKGEADYAVATWDGVELLISPLDCVALKTHPTGNLLVQFSDESCSLRPSTTLPKDLFTSLIPAAPAPNLRLVKSR